MNTDQPSRLQVTLSGETRVHIIIGDPIAQVKSPFGMTQKFAARGINAIVIPARVPPNDLNSFFAGIEGIENVDSIIITIPHKFACYDLCKETSERARALLAVQCMRRLDGGGWYGENFDGVSFVEAAKANGAALQDKRALLVGAGGAGSAIGLALLEAGVRELSVHDTDIRRRDELISRLSRFGRVLSGEPSAAGIDFVAHATPLGMREGDPLPIDVTTLSPSTFVGCVVTKPTISPLIAEARAVGCKTSTGVEMSGCGQEMSVNFALGPAGN